MATEEIISLDCPYCQASIIQPLSWFKQTYATCPNCKGGLAAAQFALRVDELEQALDASVEEMVMGPPESSCDCAAGGCGGGCGPAI